MLRRSFWPASRRNSAPSGVRRLVAPLLAATLCSAPALPAAAHEGDDHGAPALTATPGLPRLAAKSELYELVAVLNGDHLTIYLDKVEDNAPVTGANISVRIEGEPVAAEATANDTYVVASKLFGGRAPVELIFDIKSPLGDDLLIGTLPLPQTASAPSPTRWYERLSAALRHGVQDHLILMVLSLLVGTGLGIVLRARRPTIRPALIPVTIMLAVTATRHSAHAHEGQDHADTAMAAGGVGDTAHRLPDGKLFLPKPMQRILDIRTVIAKTEMAPKTVVLVGRVITNPSRSGLVQSINGGRVNAPNGGLPRIGQAVVKGQVLAEIERVLQQSERTTISERSGEIEQLIAVTEARLKRLRLLAERGVVLQSLVVEAEIELEGLRRRREVIRETRIEPEVLRAPIDGVIASSRVISGQVVQGQDVLFQVIDPTTLWIEAYSYGDVDPATFTQATAIGASGAAMRLAFRGWSRTLQQHATVVQFEIADPPASIRVGQPVTVTAQQADTAAGMIVSRDALVRGGNGETIVWRHVAPEQFEPRPVRTEPFDATRVVIVAGAEDGDRIVVRGAELINQIR
jgi:cobalt-zinc-cadmium efflux system membrane fusion protein